MALQNDDGDTALMFASMRGSAPLIELLLDAGADVNAKNKARASRPSQEFVALGLTRAPLRK